MNELQEDIKTLEALTESSALVKRLFKLMQLMTRIRLESPELWEKIEAFAKNTK